MGLGNLLGIIVNHLLIGGMIGLGYQDECTSVYGYTLDRTNGESWLKVIK